MNFFVIVGNIFKLKLFKIKTFFKLFSFLNYLNIINYNILGSKYVGVSCIYIYFYVDAL